MSSIKRITPAIRIAPNHETRDRILAGKIRGTLREGVCPYKRGPAMLCCAIDPFAAEVDITDVRGCRLSEVSQEEREACGYASEEHMLEDLRRSYDTLSLESWVTIVRWQNVRGALVDDYLDRHTRC